MSFSVTSSAEQLLYSTVRVETTYDDGHGAGTAFLYQHQIGEEKYAFLVSAKHVVDGATRGQLLFTAADGTQPRLGEQITVGVDDFTSAWFGHPDNDVDIAIMPAAPILNQMSEDGKPIFTRPIPSDFVPDQAALDALDALEQVVFVGYPNGMYDTVNLTPIVRVGVTATHPALNYCGRDAFLIDASVFPGSSGSPVLILNTGSYAAKGGGIVIGSRVLFLGILSGVFTRLERGEVELSEIPTASSGVAFTKEMIDLGYVLKSKLVQETVTAFLADRGVVDE